MKHIQIQKLLFIAGVVGFISYFCVNNLTSTTDQPKSDHKQKKSEMQARRDPKLEKKCKELCALIKKEDKRPHSKHREKFIEKLFEESFLLLQSNAQPIDLQASFDQLPLLIRELKGKDLTIFFKGSTIRNQVRTLSNLLERLNENGPFVKKLKKEETTGDNLPYILPFLNHYLFLLAHSSKLTSLFVQALSHAQKNAITNRATRLNQTMIALLLDLRHISFALTTLRDSLKAFHGPIRYSSH